MELLGPSIAAIVWAFVWLQHTRDKRLLDKHIKALDYLEDQRLETVKTFGAVFERVAYLERRDKEHEQQISQLTDKAFR